MPVYWIIYLYLQGAVYGIFVCGLKTLRVLINHDEILFPMIHIQQLVQMATYIYCLLIVFLIMLNKFMFICVWKRMRQMDDDLIVAISIVWAIFMRWHIRFVNKPYHFNFIFIFSVASGWPLGFIWLILIVKYDHPALNLRLRWIGKHWFNQRINQHPT